MYDCIHAGRELTSKRFCRNEDVPHYVVAFSTCETCTMKSSKPKRIKPGDALTKMFSRFGFKETKGCACASIRQRMNNLGVKGCLEKEDDIVRQIVNEAVKRNLGPKIVLTPIVRRFFRAALKKAAQ